MATPYKQLVYEPDYGDEAVDVGPQFNEFAAGPSQPSSITQPAAPGPSVIPQTGGPGTITYGETVVKPEKVTQQPLPWWYQDYLNKEQATVDREKAAQREADARYWAEQEFKKRVGNIVPRSMAEAVAASKEMSKIEGQLGMQYDIRAGVPVEQALAKWGGKIWSDKMPITGRQLAGSPASFTPRSMNVAGVDIIETRPGVWQQTRTPTGVPSEITTFTTPEGQEITQIGKSIVRTPKKTEEPRVVTIKTEQGDTRFTVPQAVNYLESKIASLTEQKKTEPARKAKQLDNQIAELNAQLSSLQVGRSPSTAKATEPTVKRYTIQNGKLVPRQ